VTPASFGQRAAAFALDVVVVAVLGFVVGGALDQAYWTLTPPLLPTDPAWPLDSLIGFLMVDLPVMAIPVLYFVLGWSGTRGQTLGQRAVGVRTLDDRDRPPSVVRSMWRLIARTLALLPFGLGAVEMIWHRRGRTWHDVWSGTRVVSGHPPPRPRRRRWGPTLALTASSLLLLTSLIVLDNRIAGGGVEAELVSLRELDPGTCYVQPDWEDEGVRRVPCGEEQDAEVYFSYTDPAPSGDPYDEEALDASARERCGAELASYVGWDPGDAWEVEPVYPDPQSWDDGERRVVCTVWGWSVPGSARGAGRTGTPTLA